MLESPLLAAFEAQLAGARARHPQREPPLPATVEIVLTGAQGSRFLVETATGRILPRGQLGSPLSIHVPRAEFEHLVTRGLQAWFVAYDKGIVRLEGAPAKVEAVEVYVERVLRER